MIEGETWVTVVVDDESYLGAIILAESLRRTKTNRRILVLVGPKVSKSVRQTLERVFDGVIRIPILNLVPKSPKDVEAISKLVCWTLPFPYKKCVFLDNTLLVLQNADELFQLTGIWGGRDISGLVLTPNLDEFDSIERKLNESTAGGNWEQIISNWITSRKEFQKLDSKYFYPVTLQSNKVTLPIMKPKIVRFEEMDPFKVLKGGIEIEQENNNFSCEVFEYWKTLFEMAKSTYLSSSMHGQNISNRANHEPIAVVGLSCRLPGANSVSEFWDILINGRDEMKNIPDSRWTAAEGCFPTSEERAMPAGYLKCPVDVFDGKFFGMSPAELDYADPQQRLLLEVAWEALEDAAIPIPSLQSTQTSIFAGIWKMDYYDLMTETGFRLGEFYRSYMGNAFGATAGRLAFLLGVTGSNVSTESGCSSSIVALGLAMKSLRAGETNVALACGVNLILHPFSFETMQAVISPDGHCKTFDENANGFARAEGCGVLVLKRLSDAIRDNDRIYSLLRGYGEAQEGPSRSMGTPTIEVEAMAMEMALMDANVHPSDVQFVEAHGTGTSVGDPMEISAIAKAYSKNRTTPLMIGSVKTNVGHTESCSGITGLIKTILALENETIPPHINLKTLNPKINLESIPAEIPLVPKPWKKLSSRRRFAGVSSYGITGTDAHVIVEEPPDLSDAPKFTKILQPSLDIFTVSAKTEEALIRLVKTYALFITENPTVKLSDLCYTANAGRTHFAHRIAIVASSSSELKMKLTKNSFVKGQLQGNVPKIVFLFTGQGSQYHNMGRQLYDSNVVFRNSFDECERIFREEYSIDFKKHLWSREPSNELKRTLNSQAAIFTLEYGLLKMWKSWGVNPDMVLGHSFGEVPAAFCQNYMNLEDSIRLVVERSKLIDSLPAGKMLAVRAGLDKVNELVHKMDVKPKDFWIDVATINHPEQTVVSGRPESIKAFQSFCERNKILSIILEANQGFHSRDMDTVLPLIKERLKSKIKFTEPNPTCKYISAVDGCIMDKQMDISYWQRHTRHNVKFIDASKEAYKTGGRIFIEIGSQPILSALVMRNNDSVTEPIICLPSIKQREDEWKTVLSTLAKLYTMGVPIDFKGFYDFTPVNKIQLPFYPFQRKRFWFTPPKNKAVNNANGKKLHPLVGSIFPNPTSNKIFQSFINLDNKNHSFLKDHCIGSFCIYPGAGYLELIIGAAHASTLAKFEDFYPPLTSVEVENLLIASPMEMSKDETELQIIVNKEIQGANDQTGYVNVSVFSHQGNSSMSKKWVQHANARFIPYYRASETTSWERLEDSRLQEFQDEEYDTKEFYQLLKNSGLNFGQRFHSLKSFKRSSKNDHKQLLFNVELPEGHQNFLCHPIIADAMIQALQVHLQIPQNTQILRVPVSIGKFVWYAKASENSLINYIHVYEEMGAGQVAVLYDQDGKKLAMMSGVQVISTSMQSITNSLQTQKQNLPMLFEDEWKSVQPLITPEHETISKDAFWIIFSTGTNLEKAIVKKLENCGKKVLRVWPALKYGHLNDNVITVNPRAKEDIMKVFTSDIKSNNVEGILYLLGYMTEMELEQKIYTQGYLNIIQSILQLKIQPKLITITKGVVSIGDQGPCFPHPATLWGISKTFRSEHPNIHCKTIDVDPEPELENVYAQYIFNELWCNDMELMIAYRNEVRYVPRLVDCGRSISLHSLSLPNSDRFALTLPSTKSISDLKFAQVALPLLTGNQIEIRVKAAGLNFKDVLNVIKPDAQFENSNSVGADFSGVITRIGPQAIRFKVGDNVLGCNFEGGALPSYVCTGEDTVVALPTKFTFNDGATLATAFATSYYCLVEIANVQKDETILVHTASGAVGIVAIQIAKFLGAKVIATAGSHRKRAFLKSIGVEHIFNSRNLDFGDGIKRVTSGKGVDMVLNSLTSAGFKEKSLDSLVSKGRFVEMSKLNIWSEEEVRKLRSDVSYTIVDLSSASLSTWKSLFLQMDKFLRNGTLKPVIYSRFDALHIREALTYLQKTKHIGKVVCVMPEVQFDSKSGTMEAKTPLFNDRATYLITGGVGGIGLEVAKWMIEKGGAKYLILVGRNQPSAKSEETISKLNSVGATVRFLKADVGKKEECKSLLESLTKNEDIPPLRGVMHAAGCLSDGLIINQSWEKFEETFNGKVVGGWNLHELTLQGEFNLEHFVVYSSVAAVLGAMGQANHSAGNAYLDALTQYRYSLGMPATSVNWGQWGQVGIAAELEITGMTPFTPNQGLHALELLMKSQRLQTTVVDGDVAVWKLIFTWAKSYLQELSTATTVSSSGDHTGSITVSPSDFWEDIDANGSKKGEIVSKYIIQILSCILKFDSTEELDINQNFQDLGLDSLMMVELKNILQNLLGSKVTLTISSITDCNTVNLLADRLLELIYGTKDKVQKRQDRKNLIREDCLLPNHIRFEPSTTKGAVKQLKDISVVLVTGVTGNLAPYIIKELTILNHIQKVYCLVRAKTKEQGKDRLRRNFENKGILTTTDMMKVEVILGNITEEFLGIDEKEYSKLGSEVEGIFHCAVKSNHLEEYRKSDGNTTDIRSVNVLGTIRILEFSVFQRLKWLFHASTLLTVLKDRNEGRLPETWPKISDFDEAANFGYAISKFVADKLLETAVENRGIPAKVFRFPMIGGDEKEGRQTVGENHPFLKYLSYLLSGVMPNFEIPVQVLSVDTCAKLSLEAFFHCNGPLGIYNITNPHYNKEQDILKLANEFGFPVKEVKFPEFVDKLKSDGEKSVLHMLAEFYVDEDRYERTVRESTFIEEWKRCPEVYYRSQKMDAIIGKEKLNREIKNSIDILRRDIQYALKTGFFKNY